MAPRGRYLQDQLLVFMALAAGESTLLAGPLSLHTRTAMHFATLVTAGHPSGGARFTLERVGPDGEPRSPTGAQEVLPELPLTGLYRTSGGSGSSSGSEGEEGEAEGLTLIRCHGVGFVRPA